MKTIFKAATIALILCATIMSGCIDDIQDTIVDKAIEKASENVMFAVSFDGGQRDNPYLLRVVINEGGTVMILPDDSSGEKMSYGNWEIYRETKDGDMYDVTYGDTELRIKMEDGGVAVGNIYENGFTKCGESFYGNWIANTVSSATDDKPTSIISNVIDSISGSGSDDLPITLLMDLDSLYEGVVFRITLEEDGRAEICGKENPRALDCEPASWEEYGSTGREYHVTSETFDDIHVKVLENGKAEFRISRLKFEGTWIHGSDRLVGDQDFVSPTPTPTPTPTVSSSKSKEGFPLTAMIKGALPDDQIRIILNDDETLEMCARGESSEGTWKLTVVQMDRGRRSFSLDMDPHCTLVLWDYGEAELTPQGGPVTFRGTWVEGIDKSWG